MLNSKFKISISMIILVFIATISTGGFTYIYTLDTMKKNTDDYLIEQAKAHAFQLNNIIIELETIVTGLEKNVISMIDENQLDDPEYFRVLSEKLEVVAALYDKNDISVMSTYARFDPKISYGTAGFFHADTNSDGLLERLEPTDLLVFDPKDRERVGWFYEPILRGSPIWMEPYYNANIDTDMVSYVKPLKFNEHTIGVVGADINFDQLRSIAQQQIEVGKLVIVDQMFQFLVHDKYSMNENLGSIDNGQLAFIQEIIDANQDGIVKYTLENEKKVLGFSKLENGWTVIVALTEAEAFTELNGSMAVLLGIIFVITIIMLFSAGVLGSYVNNMISKNQFLQRMVEERTEQLSETNHDLQNSVDELQSREVELTILNEQLQKTLEELNKMQDQIIRAEKLAGLGEVVNGLSHEINTPLGVIVTTNSYMKMQVMGTTEINYHDRSKDLLEGIEIISRASYKLKSLVRSFRMLTDKSENHDIKLVNMLDLLIGVQNDMAQIISTLVFKVDIKIDVEKNLNVISYPDVLKFIIKQLINNSIDHGFKECAYGQIAISARCENQRVHLVYKDDGIGVAKSDQLKIFEPFYSTKKNLGHTGLGLHIVYNLTTQVMEGGMKFESVDGEGVHISIEFQNLEAESKI